MQILPTITSAMAYAYIPQEKADKGGNAPSQNAAQNGVSLNNSGETDKNQNQTAQTTNQSQKSENQNSQQDANVQRVLAQLKAADREVRAHEQAHMAAGGGLTGAASYTYKTGPDGKQYAVAGEVPVDTSEGRTSEETIAKADKIRAAALAPASPSAQDYKIAQSAASMKQTAQIEKTQEENAEKTEKAEKLKEEQAEKETDKTEKNKTALDTYKEIAGLGDDTAQNSAAFQAVA